MPMTKPMQPPKNQPIGFWTARAGEAVRERTQGALREIGVTQPEWWILHQLSLQSGGIDREETIEKIGHNDTPQAVVDAISSAAAKGWLVDSGSQLHATDAGVEKFQQASELQRQLNEERMQGISEDDYVTTIRVLQRTIENVGGSAWHW